MPGLISPPPSSDDAVLRPSAAADVPEPGSGGPDVRRSYELPAAVVGGLESLVAEPQDVRVRAAAVASVMEVLYETVAWVHGDDGEHPEVASLAEILAAARAHEVRMAKGTSR